MKTLLAVSALAIVACLGIIGGDIARPIEAPQVKWRVWSCDPKGPRWGGYSIPEMLVQESRCADAPIDFVLAVAWRESWLTDPPMSPTSDVGPLQINLRTAVARGLNPVALLDARLSSATGIRWLQEYIDTCPGTRREIVWAYQNGKCRKKQ